MNGIAGVGRIGGEASWMSVTDDGVADDGDDDPPTRGLQTMGPPAMLLQTPTMRPQKMGIADDVRHIH